jgi:hypothetical protein
MDKLPDGYASIVPSPVNELPVQVGSCGDSTTKQVAEITMARAIQTFMLSEAKSKAETAELQKRLVMQQFRPCNLYPTIIYHDGLRWVCEYVSTKNQFCEYEGTDAVAYGMSPEEASQNFDRQWLGSTDEGEAGDGEDEDF